MSWKDRSRAAKPPGRSRRVGSFRSSFRAATLWEPPWGQATRRTLDPWRSSLQPSADRSPQGRDAQLGHPSPSSSPPLTAALPGTDRPTREVWTLVVHPSSVDRRPPQGAWPFDGPVSPCSSPGGSAPPGALVFLHGGCCWCNQHIGGVTTTTTPTGQWLRLTLSRHLQPRSSRHYPYPEVPCR